jgi:hypothetical protein
MRGVDAAERVRDGHSCGAERGRERAKPDLPSTEDRRPEPRKHVVEGRRRFSARKCIQHPEERLANKMDRYGLVEPEALLVEERKPQSAGERGDDRERQ